MTLWSEENHQSMQRTFDTLLKLHNDPHIHDQYAYLVSLWSLHADISLNNMIREPHNRDEHWSEFKYSILMRDKYSNKGKTNV